MEENNDNGKNGCITLNKLWQTALECNVDDPGITGTSDRMVNFVKCGNVRDFMVMATLKCWEERNTNGLPPIIISDKSKSSGTSQKSNTSANQSVKK